MKTSVATSLTPAPSPPRKPDEKQIRDEAGHDKLVDLKQSKK